MILQKLVKASCNNFFSFSLVLVFIVFFTESLNAEKIAQFQYKNHIEKLNDTVLKVNEDFAALAEYIFFDSLCDTCIASDASSIIFVIDQSTSMFMPGESGDAIDKDGARFTVPSALIDSIYGCNPKIHIGIVMFHGGCYLEPSDDEIMEQCPQDTIGAYIPLLQLDADYNGRTGYEILKYWLETEENTSWPGMTFNDLKHKPYDMMTSPTMPGTNITLAFDAAKFAMQSSIHTKDKRYIIYFSDGDATVPMDDLAKMLEFIKGKDVPTTFTVYFTEQDTVLADLEEMTDNIQKNGYSTSNPLSNLWPSITQKDTLMNLLMKNVIAKIVQKNQTLTPIQFAVNTIDPTGPWDKTGYPFQEKFPLEIFQTVFNCDLTVEIVTDSITEAGDTITTTKEKESKIRFTVDIEANAPDLPPEEFNVDYWERSIGLYHEDNAVTAVNQSMKELGLRFSEKKIDILYGYKKVKLEVKTETGSNPDKETFTLNKLSDYFSYKFTIDPDNPSSPGDGKLQLQEKDAIIITFRNEKLPRDTLILKIPFEVGNVVSLKSAYYFDNDAEGYIDSIYVRADGKIFTEDYDALKKSLTLPDFRKFTIDRLQAESGGFSLLVQQDPSTTPQTFVNDNDKLKMKEVVLPGSGMTMKGSVQIQDRVAPIIHWGPKSATVIDNLNPNITDTLQVTFSEDISNIDKNIPFYFLKTSDNNKEYTAELTVLKIKDNKAVFKIGKLNNGVEKVHFGDSIWIHEGDCIADGIGSDNNYQNNKENIKREIYTRYVIGPITLVPRAVNPYYLTDEFPRHRIPSDIISVLKRENMLNGLNLNTIKGDYVGMIIKVEPEDKENIHKDFFMSGTITIFDPMGNSVLWKQKMAFYKEDKSLIYMWNGKNIRRRDVGEGTYMAYFVVSLRPGPEGINSPQLPEQVLQLMIGVKK